jgi:aminoglycoside phosphotransferase (APT) family kinase protein
LCELDWETIESREVQIRWTCQHGDLHGANLLCGQGGMPTLIDFGSVDYGPACLDAITLELSLFFHPEGASMTGGEVGFASATRWSDLPEYCRECAYPEVVASCRGWAIQSGGGTRAVLSTVASYLIRQLKYDDTDKPTIVHMLSPVIRAFEATYE